MKSTSYTLIVVTLFVSSSCWSQEKGIRFSVHIPTIKQEATSIWRTINDIKFFEAQGYQINLPKDRLIDSLILKSKNGAFGNEDFALIYELLESKIYHKNNYLAALKKVNEQKQLICKIIHQIKSIKSSWNWEFKLFEHYKVIFTLYGSGGSYDPDSGIVTLFTTKEGEFKNYINPSNTIIHEIVHMGIEKSIVQKYDLSHVLKERVVDKIVFLLFRKFLPEYKIQNMGKTQLDALLKNKQDIKKLNLILAKMNE